MAIPHLIARNLILSVVFFSLHFASLSLRHFFLHPPNCFAIHVSVDYYYHRVPISAATKNRKSSKSNSNSCNETPFQFSFFHHTINSMPTRKVKHILNDYTVRLIYFNCMCLLRNCERPIHITTDYRAAKMAEVLSFLILFVHIINWCIWLINVSKWSHKDGTTVPQPLTVVHRISHLVSLVSCV